MRNKIHGVVGRNGIPHTVNKIGITNIQAKCRGPSGICNINILHPYNINGKRIGCLVQYIVSLAGSITKGFGGVIYDRIRSVELEGALGKGSFGIQ
jgi:hypothetical protein